MAEKKSNTSGAVHLTSLSVDITQLRKQLKAASQQIDQLAQKAVTAGEKIRQSLNMSGAGTGLGSAAQGLSGNAQVSTTQIQNLTKAYSAFVATLSSSKITDTGLAVIVQQAKAAEQALKNLTQNAIANNQVTPQMATRYRELASTLTQLQIRFNDMRTAAAEQNKQYEAMSRSIQSAISKLKQFASASVSSANRREITALRYEFENLARNLRTLSVRQAQAQLDALNARVQQLGTQTRRTNGLLTNFINHLTNRLQWMASYAILDGIFSSFRNVVNVIRETEDAVIELQRVLNNPPAQNLMADELYDIAYEYGQTFANVQEVAVRFAQSGLEWNAVIDATRATMLGLNTAELEVNTATQGLIAVMAQFHLEAEDLEAVIDKINITADNFPVTSEKIVAALQRAGGTASAFGMTLEQTIGTITALSEATGRSGEAIGTAMNSLISFTMKESSLKTFAQYFSQINEYAHLTTETLQEMNVFDVWTNLSKAMGESSDQLAQMIASTEGFKDLMNEEMASAIGLTDEYNAAVAEVNEQLVNQEDIYSTVGVYRKNYFIALLNSIDTAHEAIEGMNEALGYSQKENETAMQALSKQFNQLVVAARELAVQFGEEGFLDFMKSIVGASTGILQVVKALGGLNTTLSLLAMTFAIIKRQKITDFFISLTNFSAHIDRLRRALTTYRVIMHQASNALITFNRNLRSGQGLLNSFRLAMQGAARSSGQLMVALTSLISAMTIVFSLFSFGIEKLKQWEEQAEQARLETIELGTQAGETIKELGNAWNDYQDALDTGATEQLSQATERLCELLGIERNEINSTEEALRKLTEAKYEETKVDIARAKQAAEKQLSGWGGINPQTTLQSEMFFNWGDGKTTKFLQDEGLLQKVINPKSIEEGREQLELFNEMLERLHDNFDSDELASSDFYDTIKELRDELDAVVTSYNENDEVMSLLGANYDEFASNLEAASAGLDSVANSVNKVTLSGEELEKRIEAIQEQFEELNNRIDSFQSAYSTLNDVITEYNSTGLMTADMLQSLMELEPQYLEMLEVKNGTLSINDEKLGNLILTNDTYIDQMIALKVAEEADTIAKQLQTIATENLTEAEINARLAQMALSSSIADAALACLQGKASTEEFKNSLAELGEQSGLTGNALDVFANKAFGVFNTMANLRSMFQDVKTAPNTGAERLPRYYSTKSKTSSGGGSSSSSSSSSKSTEDKLKESLSDTLSIYEHTIFILEKNKSDAQEMVAIYKKMQEEIHALAEKYRDMGLSEDSSYIADLQEKWWSYQDKIIDLMDGIYEATVNAHENAISLLENQYNVLERGMDYSGMTENLRKQYDEQRKIQEAAHNEAERLRKAGVDENDDAIQACIKAWWSAEDAIQEINGKIADSILATYDDFLDMADKFDLWDYMDFTKVDYLQEKLGAVNKLLSEGTISLQEYNAQLRELGEAIYEAQVEQFEKQQKDIEDYYDKLIKSHEANIDNLEKEKDALKDYYDGVIDSYEAEIEVWNKRKDEVSDYYDKLIDNLRDVEESNDRINKQIDYYNERQKIITNLEQAQARSGVEWREKEMEYQQQLIDLDEDWNRTQQEWSIEDQISRLEELKEMAISDIDATIEKINLSIDDIQNKSAAAIENIDNQIESIENTIAELEAQSEAEIEAINVKIQELGASIAEAIKNGTADGFIDSQQEFDQASQNIITALGGKVAEGKNIVDTGTQDTAKQGYVTFNNMLFEPMKTSINDVASLLRTSVISSAEEAAKNSLSAFRNSLVTPLQTDLSNIMRQTQSANNNLVVNKSIGTTIGKSTKTTPSTGGNTTIYINNNVSSQDKAYEKTQNILQNLRV